MHDPEKSDSGRVAAKPTNKAGRPAAEPVEPRPGAKGNADQQSTHRTQSRVRVTQARHRDREPRIDDLHRRVQRGAYRPQPSRRTYIPKADGKQRPLAIAALEDKIVQGATVILLNAIYEGDFCGFSYGFRPGRGPHDALDALSTAIKIRKVNWILDADIQNCFGLLAKAG